jgi:transposase InsO family protein
MYRRHIRRGDKEEIKQLVTPQSYREELFRQAHAGFTGGQMGERRTLEQVRRRAYWVGWAADTRRMLRRCTACCSYKRGLPSRQGHLQQMNTGMPWERVGIDITGPHPKSKNGFIYIVTLIDYFSKWAEAFPIRNQEAHTVAKVLVDRVFSHFGMPLQILTDRGANFESLLFNELCRCLNIDHVRTTVYKPPTNGMVERFHGILNSILGTVVAESQRDWDQHLPYAVAAYRATVHESTGFSPNYLFVGREVRASLDIVMGLPSSEEYSSTSADLYVERQLQDMRDAYRAVRERLKVAANRQK